MTNNFITAILFSTVGLGILIAMFYMWCGYIKKKANDIPDISLFLIVILTIFDVAFVIYFMYQAYLITTLK